MLSLAKHILIPVLFALTLIEYKLKFLLNPLTVMEIKNDIILRTETE